MDIGSALGLALAQISNEEDQNPNNIIKHGVGTDENNIRQWVDDIWETYDFNDDGNIDKREIKKFINQTFEKVNVKFEYNEFDLDDFFNQIDITEDGMISKAELKNYFKKLGNKEPDELLRKELGLFAGIPPPKKDECDDADIEGSGGSGSKVSDAKEQLDSDRKGLVENENYDTARSEAKK